MFIAGLSIFSFSAVIAAYCYLFGSNDDSTGAVFLIFCVAAAVGLLLMLFGRMKQKNNATLKSIENNNVSDFCPNCKVNVSSQTNQCPICGTELRKR